MNTLAQEREVFALFEFLQTKSPDSILEWVIFLGVEYRESFWKGMLVTLHVAILGTLIGFVLGFIIGIVDDHKINSDDNIFTKILLTIVKVILRVFVEIFRGTPMIVQGMVVYYGLRQGGVDLTSITAGILVTTLNTGAYISETVRGGIKAINVGQKEGAYAMGMSPLATMFCIILPQVFKNIIPEMCNMFLTNLKMTSVLNVIGVSELFLTAKTVASNYYKYFETYLVIGFIYLVLCLFFTCLVKLLESKMDKKRAYQLATEYMD